jgi:TRAP-type mannitol/chloroaromatic compound transport system permease small subunit
MSFIAIGKTMLRKMDLFASMQFLRFKHDAETKTMTGGLISFAIMVVLAVTFSSMIIDTFNKVLINAVQDASQA